jgi:hypothetical protein
MGACSLVRNSMDELGPAGESLRLSQHYRQMSDEELIQMAQNPSELTELAQEALAQEISARRLQGPRPGAVSRSVVPPPDEEDESPYADDRKLVTLCMVWSRRDAHRLQTLLHRAGIPFFIGKEKATNVDEVSSNFGDGLEVQVMRAAFPYVAGWLHHYEPQDVPRDEQDWGDPELAIHCPRCHSTDVVFDNPDDEQLYDGTMTEKFAWACASCGNRWIDDGLAS